MGAPPGSGAGGARASRRLLSVGSRAALMGVALLLTYSLLEQQNFGSSTRGSSGGSSSSSGSQAPCKATEDAAAAAAAASGDEPQQQAARGAPQRAKASRKAGGGGGVRHVYVVGCGHSGTSLLKRTIAHLPGMHCIPKESWLWSRRVPGPDGNYVARPLDLAAVRHQLRQWDREAAAAGFSSWVEKTPMHVHSIGDILKHDPSARVVLIVRDGRDVAASLARRGFPLDQGTGRWKADNAAALPFLDRPEVLMVRFEEFFSADGVLRVLRALAAHLGVAAPAAADARLLLALQPPPGLLTGDEQCAAFQGEGDKEAQLAATYVQLLSGRTEDKTGAAPDRKDHQAFRSWQSSLAWAPQAAGRWAELLDAGVQAAMAGDTELQQLLARLGYT